jgi:hypothetical protein
LALAGSRAQASSSGSTIRPVILRLARQGAPGRACLGRALEPRGAGWLRKLASLSGNRAGASPKQQTANARLARVASVPLAQWGIGGWPTTAVPFQTRRLPVKPTELAGATHDGIYLGRVTAPGGPQPGAVTRTGR